MPNTIKERLAEYLRHKMLSVREFERQCGLSNGLASRISTSTNPNTLRKISSSCDLNVEWLLTGEGEMQNPSNSGLSVSNKEFRPDFKEHKNVMVPLVHIDSVGGIHSPNLLTSGEQYVERMIPFPDARTGDVAIFQSGNSMAPTIPAGAILQIRKVEQWQEYFGYGSDFVLWLDDDRRITKQVLKCVADPKRFVVCHSYNPEVADEELPKAMIREVWKVVNVLINKGW